MRNRTDEIVAALEHDWPNYQIWVIHKAIGGTTWCARRWDAGDNGMAAINADSPEELVELLEDEASR
jgi:hypothetical protein